MTVITVDGREFESVRQAAEVVGFSRPKLMEAVKRGIDGKTTYRGMNVQVNMESLMKASNRPVAVRCVETGQIYESYRQAAIGVNLSNGVSIKTAIETGRMAGNFHWEKVNE